MCMDEPTTLTQRLLSVFQKGSEVSSAPPVRWLGGLEVLTVEGSDYCGYIQGLML